MKKSIIIIGAIIIVLCLVVPIGYSASEEINFELTNISFIKKNVLRNTNIQRTFKGNVNSGWPLIYDRGDEDASRRVIVDSEGNIIVFGYTYDADSNDSDFLTIKYTDEGDELWNVTYDGGKFDYPCDIALDSRDNIIVFGFNYSSIELEENMDFVFHLIKYDKNGLLQWSKSYLWDDVDDSFPGGIACDLNDNILLTGGYGNLDYASFHCWIQKMDENGNEIWNRTYVDDLVSIGFDVEVNSEDDILAGGLFASIFGQGWYIVKYDHNGNKKWAQRYNDGNMIYDLEIDSGGNIILTGQDFSDNTNSSSWLTLKSDKNGNLLWKKEYDSLASEYGEDCAIDSNDNVITVGPIYGYDYYEACIIIYDKNGEEICMKKPIFDGIFMGVTVDENENIIATGLIDNSFDFYNTDFYTFKFSDNTAPSARLEKPELGFLYVFDKKLIPLIKNTFIFGKIKVQIIADNPSDVKKTVFYLDENLVETLDAPPYEWLWDSKTFGKHSLEIHVYDENENINRETINVWKFF